MELKDTVKLMESKDYKDRFKAEYYQLKIRLDKLETMVDKWRKGMLTFEPTCSLYTYTLQISSMKAYLDILKQRAKIEGVEL